MLPLVVPFYLLVGIWSMIFGGCCGLKIHAILDGVGRQAVNLLHAAATRSHAAQRVVGQAVMQHKIRQCSRAPWGNQPMGKVIRHRAAAVTGTTSRRWRRISTPLSRRSHKDNVASMGGAPEI